MVTKLQRETTVRSTVVSLCNLEILRSNILGLLANRSYEVGVKGLEPLRPYDQRILSP
ncbi:MAG: hypothetical protein RLZZ139_1607 [Cyanobacteriota bacterium]|jgi:hypothetical protein